MLKQYYPRACYPMAYQGADQELVDALLLHSNYLGEELGLVKVPEVLR